MTAALPVILLGVHYALEESSTDAREWVPHHLPEVQRYEWFQEHFETEDLVIISWPGCSIDDPRLDDLADALLKASTDASAEGRPAYFSRVMTSHGTLAEMTSPPLDLSRGQAMHRLRGVLVGRDGETGCAVVVLSPQGAEDREGAVETIYAITEQTTQISRDELRLGGTSVDAVELDEVSSKASTWLTLPCVIVGALLAWRFLRSFRLMISVFIVALFCQAFCVALVFYTGRTMDAVLIAMPGLMFVLAISSGIHMANYYRDAASHLSAEEAPYHAILAGLLPCGLAALTTAIGLGSLAVSEIVPVRLFGIYSATTVLVVVVLLFFYMPGAWLRWPLHASLVADAERTANKGRGRAEAVWARLALFVSRNNLGLTAMSVVMMVGLGVGLAWVRTSVKVQNMFAPDTRTMRNYAWFEERIGPLVPVEVVLRFDPDCPLQMAERMELTARVHREIDAIDRIDGVMSPITFAPDVPPAAGLRHHIRRQLVERRFQARKDRIVEARYLADSEEGELWRVSARIEALNDVPYRFFFDELRNAVEPLLAAQREAGITGVSAVYTGVVPLIDQAQRVLLNDLRMSFLTAFALIAIVMTIILRSPVGGVLSMIPNIFPIAVVFGALGWLGWPVDIGSMMSASVALGIAVDDTLHFVTWYSRGVRSGQSAARAVQSAYRHTAKAMLQTTVICAAGMLIFSFSSFLPTARFAWMLAALLVAALVGDLIFLPAILSGPLGRFFAVRIANGGDPRAEPLAVPEPHGEKARAATRISRRAAIK